VHEASRCRFSRREALQGLLAPSSSTKKHCASPRGNDNKGGLDFDLAGEITPDENGARRLGQIKAFAFGISGKRFMVALSSSLV
jgi:hypothetical protein